MPAAPGPTRPGIELRYSAGPEPPVSLSGQDRFALGADGSLAVFDLTASRIHRWGPTGEYLGAFGRKGQGPGEIRGGDDLRVGPEGEIVAVQFLNFRMSAWSADGTSLWDRPLDGSASRMVVKGDTLWVKRQPQLGGTPMNPMILEALSLHTGEPLGVADTLLRAPGTETETRPTCFGCRWVAGPDDTFLSFVVDPGQGTLVTQFRLDGTEVRRFGNLARAERPYLVEELQFMSDMNHERLSRTARTLGMRSVPPPRSVEDLAERAGNHPRYMWQGFGGVDALGRVWLLPAPSAAGEVVLEVFGSEGDLLGEVPLDLARVVELEVAGTVLVVRQVDEFGLPSFHVFDIAVGGD